MPLVEFTLPALTLPPRSPNLRLLWAGLGGPLISLLPLLYPARPLDVRRTHHS